MNTESAIQRLLVPLYRSKGWIYFIGVLAILQGILSAILALFGAWWGILVCWIPVWLGVLLCQTSRQLQTAFERDDEAAARTSLGKLGLYFKIVGILSILAIVIMVGGFLIAILIPAFMKAREAAGR